MNQAEHESCYILKHKNGNRLGANDSQDCFKSIAQTVEY